MRASRVRRAPRPPRRRPHNIDAHSMPRVSPPIALVGMGRRPSPSRRRRSSLLSSLRASLLSSLRSSLRSMPPMTASDRASARDRASVRSSAASTATVLSRREASFAPSSAFSDVRPFAPAALTQATQTRGFGVGASSASVASSWASDAHPRASRSRTAPASSCDRDDDVGAFFKGARGPSPPRNRPRARRDAARTSPRWISAKTTRTKSRSGVRAARRDARDSSPRRDSSRATRPTTIGRLTPSGTRRS